MNEDNLLKEICKFLIGVYEWVWCVILTHKVQEFHELKEIKTIKTLNQQLEVYLLLFLQIHSHWLFNETTTSYYFASSVWIF